MWNGSASQDVPATAIMTLVIVDQTNFLVGLKAYVTGGIHIWNWELRQKSVTMEIIGSIGKATVIK